MFTSLIGKITRIAGGNGNEPQQYDETEEEEEEEDKTEDIKIPMVRTGLSTRRNVPVPSQPESQQNGGDKEVEKTKGTGMITALDWSGDRGVIDRTYQFEPKKCCPKGVNFQRGSKVEFEAEKTRACPQWQVTSMKLVEFEEKPSVKEKQRFRSVVAQIKSVTRDVIEVEAGKEKSKPRLIRIPIQPEFMKYGFSWMPGDWVQIELENVLSDAEFDDDIPANFTKSKILSFAPLGSKIIVGKITRRHHNFLIDDSVYFTEDVCKSTYSLGTAVRCEAIQSTQYIDSNNDSVSWRAIKVEKSEFLHYTAPGAAGESDGGFRLDSMGRTAMDQYAILKMDKEGIEITPRYLNFPPQLIGSSSKKQLTIKNNSSREIRLHQIKFSQESTVGQFVLYSIHAEPEGGMTLLSGDEVKYEVICSPKIIGKTKEVCIFDFGTFKIGREFSTVGRSEEESMMKVDNTKQRPNFKKQIGEQDITRIITDRERRRIRGSQTVRAPFFSQKRLPLNKVPNELYQIMKTQDEKELRKIYPNALLSLQFNNYLEKFRVSLWFEEIENDLRRRQYDMKNVRLTRQGGTPVHFTFPCPGILDFQPPVNVSDTIDAFDEDNPNNAKFQGTIMKINDNEVSCTFGEAFNVQYTGYPMTVQFNLGRTNYKRCQYAVQTAVDHLGQEFLFPENDVIVKHARISTHEDDENAEKPEVVTCTSINQGKEESLFRKATPTAIFRTGNSEAAQNGQSMQSSEPTGRRVQSVRSRFVSNTASAPSTENAKLEWFNTNLNQEQKNAVRRILRGQARPLPYIIFGPPGTGKTVTVVEAIMQVNKLDRNSRVLVCAPSNAAADVIAEYLANSNQYHPGDFIRLNGFLRAGQSMMDSVAPFCTDGDDLHNVAMHRLIVCTCMTAGQFFSLDLSLGHFTHVFIDEAGYCTEPEAMVPTILLAKSKGGQLILAGDPNQLGPVLMSDVSQNCGLNRSLLERLMARNLYSRDPDRFHDEKYNPLVLTKLVKNYRAHPTLLNLPSRLFYDDDLISHASFDEAYALCQDPRMKDVLVSQGVPLIFEGVQGTCTRERDSPSWCNISEAMKVAHYVSALIKKCGLNNDDIGIITPYRKQVEKIRTALTLNLKDVDIPKVASVEEFQGGERKVIIISTVRSVNESKIDGFLDRLGFLYQPKRFNVVITRAKALMIVIGNPHVLARNQYWNQLLKYSIELNAYTGCNLPIFLNQNMAKLAFEQSSEFTPTPDDAEEEVGNTNGNRVAHPSTNGIGVDGETVELVPYKADEEFEDCQEGF